jgi:hypothetical protein
MEWWIGLGLAGMALGWVEQRWLPWIKPMYKSAFCQSVIYHHPCRTAPSISEAPIVGIKYLQRVEFDVKYLLEVCAFF